MDKAPALALLCMCACEGSILEPAPSPSTGPQPGPLPIDGCQGAVRSPAPAQLRRLTPDQLQSSAADVLGVPSLALDLGVPSEGIISEIEVSKLELAVEQLV